ncbi:MAG: hypothetical protein ACFB00_01270 [Parvularculaceae bacterium]
MERRLLSRPWIGPLAVFACAAAGVKVGAVLQTAHGVDDGILYGVGAGVIVGAALAQIMHRAARRRRETAADDEDARRESIFVMDADDAPSDNYLWAENWLARNGGRVKVVDHVSGGYEHQWDVEGPADILSEIPEELRCDSEWTRAEDPSARRLLSRARERRPE